MKYFFSRKKNYLAILIIIGIVILVGWRIWIVYQTSSERNSLLEYENIVNESDDQPQTLIAMEKFAENNKNIYGVLASLKVVKHYVNSGEFQKAVIQLQNGLISLRDNNLKAIINLRLSRIQIQQRKIDQALKTLDLIKEIGFSPIIADIRGDALLSTGDKKGAFYEWKKGMSINDLPETLSEIIKMKISNLSI